MYARMYTPDARESATRVLIDVKQRAFFQDVLRLLYICDMT